MKAQTITVQTSGEAFYSITKQVQSFLTHALENASAKDGMLHLFCRHTSCALTINESYDPAAATDMHNFLKYLAPRYLAFIQHDDEGPDDSPSHMKSILLQPHLSIFVENGKLLLGTWQGIYLAEFRDAPKERSLLIKFVAD